VGVTSDRHWKRFCDAFGLRALGEDPRLITNNDRVAQRAWLIPELQEVFKTLTREELFKLCEAAEIPFSPVAKPEDLFADPQLNEGGGLLETTLAGGIKTKLPRIPLRIGSYDFGWRNDPPEMGQDCQEILESIGLSPDEIQELRREKIVVA
jgi:crotonobetainyl-CoA:carnitine CoA-transferase CaiB-like acyl-CoA transferase